MSTVPSRGQGTERRPQQTMYKSGELTLVSPSRAQPPTEDAVAMAYKTRSDSLMLMRQIKNLKDMDSNLGGDLEVSSRTFLSGVQIVRTGKKPEVINHIAMRYFVTSERG